MHKVARVVTLFVVVLMTLIAVNTAFGQDLPPRIAYYIGFDSGGVRQVYQRGIDEESEPRQITDAAQDVITFGVAYDGLSIAYVSESTLWLQPIHTDEPEALTTVSSSQYLGSPVYSQGGQYIAYTDDGVWLLDLSTRQAKQILANVPVKEDGSNAGEFRIYKPHMFVVNEDGNAEKLIVDVGIWEWQTTGVYDLENDELQILEGQMHTGLLPLSDGRVLLYGNNGAAGEFALHIADLLDDINDYTELVRFADLTEDTLFAEQAVEIQPGTVRVFGPAISPSVMEDITAFYFDIDVADGSTSPVEFVKLSSMDESSYTVTGSLSPDGNLVPVYLRVSFDDFGILSGDFKLLNLANNAEPLAEFSGMISLFRWQGQ